MKSKKEKILDKAIDGEWITMEEVKEFADNSKTSSINFSKRIPSKNPKEFKSGGELWQHFKKLNAKIKIR